MVTNQETSKRGSLTRWTFLTQPTWVVYTLMVTDRETPANRNLPLAGRFPSTANPLIGSTRRPNTESFHGLQSKTAPKEQKKITIINRERFEENYNWLSLLYITKFLDYIPPLTNADISNKCDISATFSLTCMHSSWEKNRGAHYHVPSRVLVMTPKQAIHQSRTSNNTENSPPARRTVTKLQTKACKMKEDTYAKIVIPEQRRTRRRHPIRAQTINPLILEPSSNTLMFCATCLLQGKKGVQIQTSPKSILTKGQIYRSSRR